MTSGSKYYPNIFMFLPQCDTDKRIVLRLFFALMEAVVGKFCEEQRRR